MADPTPTGEIQPGEVERVSYSSPIGYVQPEEAGTVADLYRESDLCWLEPRN